jgi:drug/metabolite transporter (DMT)-like permease
LTVCEWFGLTDASALVATLVSLASRTIMLRLAGLFTGGIPRFAPKTLWVFVGLGVLQTATGLLIFVGLQKIGTARSQPLRIVIPLWSSLTAISFMNEQAGPAVLGGTILLVLGVALITWQSDKREMDLLLVACSLFSWRGNSCRRCFSAAPVMVWDY